MAYVVPIEVAREKYPEFEFIKALTPSAQKAAFHVRDIDGNDLCLKLIAPDCNLVRLDREVRALQSISHPNVARFIGYTYSSHPGNVRHFLLEEFVEGHDLTEELNRDEVWELTRAAGFFSYLAEGLTALSNLTLVHRDLKPSNIRVREDGTPVIIDFGLVRDLSLPAVTDTSEGAAIGTPLYFAPEQWTGTKYDIDHRTDLFALGILIYEAVVGNHPFFENGMNRDELREAACESYTYAEEENFEALPREWRILISRLLEKTRARRPHNAGQVCTVLRKIGGLL